MSPFLSSRALRSDDTEASWNEPSEVPSIMNGEGLPPAYADWPRVTENFGDLMELRGFRATIWGARVSR
jgi:hypothetical protein